MIQIRTVAELADLMEQIEYAKIARLNATQRYAQMPGNETVFEDWKAADKHHDHLMRQQIAFAIENDHA